MGGTSIQIPTFCQIDHLNFCYPIKTDIFRLGNKQRLVRIKAQKNELIVYDEESISNMLAISKLKI